jgi:hypothetical protein
VPKVVKPAEPKKEVKKDLEIRKSATAVKKEEKPKLPEMKK